MYPDDILYYTIHFICLGSIYGIYRQKRIQINNETFLVSICRVFRGLASVKPIKTGTIFIFHVLKSIFIILTSLVGQKFSYSISLKNLLKSLNLILIFSSSWDIVFKEFLNKVFFKNLFSDLSSLAPRHLMTNSNFWPNLNLLGSDFSTKVNSKEAHMIYSLKP